MDWIAVAADFGKADHIRRRYLLGQLLGLPHSEIFKIERLQREHYYHSVGRCARYKSHTKPISTTLIRASPVNKPMVASAPNRSIISAPADGAKACTIRLGKAILPISRGKRTGPNSARGKVPRPTQETP